MNARKRGHPHHHPDLFIQWMACVHLFLYMPYQQMKGFPQKISLFVPGLQSANYTTLFRRIWDLDFSIQVNPELLCVLEHPIHRVLRDGAYNRNHVFNTIERRENRSGIKTRDDASTRSQGSAYRAKYVQTKPKIGGL